MQTMQMSVENERAGNSGVQDAARRGQALSAVIVCFAALSAYAQGQGSLSTLPYATQTSTNSQQERTATLPVDGGGGIEVKPTPAAKRPDRPDFNREVFYRHKLEYSLDVGWLPINIPFPFDALEGDPYDLYPLRYTLVPVLASVRWHLGNLWGPPVLRGNWDLTCSLGYTAIPRGAETRYFSYNMGLRRNFVPRNWQVIPYFDMRAGLGFINAKGPLGVYYAQGQNFTFNLNMGSGLRYSFSPRYAISAGLNWMHISNGNLSAPRYSNYGINVYGPMIGIDIQIRRHRQQSE